MSSLVELRHELTRLEIASKHKVDVQSEKGRDLIKSLETCTQTFKNLAQQISNEDLSKLTKRLTKLESKLSLIGQAEPCELKSPKSPGETITNLENDLKEGKVSTFSWV
jgi:CII-binding regulator of phage lambda lysogenization HflD